LARFIVISTVITFYVIRYTEDKEFYKDSVADVVISNCVINLTLDKVVSFREIYRILRSNGRMVISDLVTSKEVGLESVNSEDWCSCIDGALTKENYIESIRKAGFKNIETSQEKFYIERDGRKITSVVIKAVK
jgi:arsenite methyltransferase